MSELENPEFWVGISFCLVVLVGVYPFLKKIKIWGKGQADIVKKELDEARSLRQEAEDLYAKYEAHTRNLEQEKSAILQSAEQEVLLLQKEADEKLSSRLAKKKQDVQARIQMLQENTRKELTEKMMRQVVDKTKTVLSEKAMRQSPADMDDSLKKTFKILEQIKHS